MKLTRLRKTNKTGYAIPFAGMAYSFTNEVFYENPPVRPSAGLL